MGFKGFSRFVAGAHRLGYLISIHSVIIPLFLSLSKLKLTDTRLGINPGVCGVRVAGVGAPVHPVHTRAAGQPDRVRPHDGAGIMRTFLALIVPMSIPVAVTVAILARWASGTIRADPCAGQLADTLSLPYGFLLRQPNQYPGRLADGGPWSSPCCRAMIVYFIFNRQIAIGVVAGAFKG